MRDDGPSLADLIKGATVVTTSGVQRMKDYGTTIDRDAQLMRLKEDADRYRSMVENGCQFKIYDVVTPRPEYAYNGVGMPHIVVEVLPPDQVVHHWNGSETGSRFGVRSDMRIAVLVDDDTISHFWVESSEFEYYHKD